MKAIEAVILTIMLVVLLLLLMPSGDTRTATVILVVATILLFLFGLRRRPRQSELARAIALYHVRQIKSALGLSDLQIGASYPLYQLDGNSPRTHDVKLISSTGEDKGYIVANLDRAEFPIPEFTTKGPCLTEQFRKKLGRRDFRIVWINPTYSLALDKDGKILTTIGSDLFPDRPDSEQSAKPTEREFLQFIREAQEKWRARHKKAVAEAWRMLPGGGTNTTDLVEDQPTGNYSIDYAEGYEREPDFRQIPPGVGANTKDYYSGCGPTAWATLIAWHDLNWTPELLRGSENYNGGDYGSPVEPAWNTYIDRVIMELGRKEYLDTHKSSKDGGYTSDAKMEHGFDYIRQELGRDFTGRATGDDNLQKVYDSIIIDRRPVLIKTPSHFCVAAGFWFDNDGQNHYLLLNTGWGASDKWIKSKYSQKYWYLKDVLPGTELTVPNISPVRAHGPVLCTSPSPSGVHDSLWAFWMNGDQGRIECARSTGWQSLTYMPDPHDALDGPAIYPPAVAAEVDSQRIYLLWVDDAHRMHLIRWEGPEKDWTRLEFPSDLKTLVRPAIVGRQGDWLTVAFSDDRYGLQVISTCRDVQRPNPHPWPDQIGCHQADCYWDQVDPFGTPTSLSMVTFQGPTPIQDQTVLAWLRAANYLERAGHIAFRLAKPDGSFCGYVDSTLDLGNGSLNLAVSNKTLFATYRDWEGRVAICYLQPTLPNWGQNPYNPSTPVWIPAQLSWAEVARLTETCEEDPYLGFIDLEQGKHPQLVLGRTSTIGPMYLRLLSMDVPSARLDYRGIPY